ncbi:hydrogenase iron-sulfur subunit [Candidatus Bathyarchaeota archaeon]|nr:hydrogenase iron-sulfur subunit [Candidatus Bathyarchaeota archaeon]
METAIRIGVYICHCGGNISDTVDVEKVKEAVSKLDNVKIVETVDYLCSTQGQSLIKSGIKDYGINRVVVASCSLYLHLGTFRRAVSEAGLNPYLLEMVNIREHCSWVHDNIEQATKKAIDIVRGAVNRVRHLEVLHPIKTKVKKEVLVIGGGISGIQAALEMADKGYQVYLVERNPCIGGHMAQLSETFPTLDCSYCILAPRMVSVSQHPRIKIITMAEPVALEGMPGDYTVTIRVKPRYVDIEKCTGCDECTKVCPVEVPDEFNLGLTWRKAIYIPYPQGTPRAYVIDTDNCLGLAPIACGKCIEVCDPGAINYDMQPEEIKLDVGAIILATGYEQISPNDFGEYSYGTHPDIVTNLQFERIMHLGFKKPSDGRLPKKVAFVLCVGSRALQERAKEYCCKIGCMVAIKQAIMLKKAIPNVEPWIFYQDIRADGKGYEEFYARAREQGVKFVRGLAARVLPTNDGLIVKAEDTIAGMPVEEKFDMVVLSLGITPRPDTEELAKIFGLHTGPDGFFMERHYKLNPVDSAKEGIFVSGCALGPKDIRESVEEGMAAASRAATFIGQGELEVSPEVPVIDRGKCDLCGKCVEICPTKAITIKDSSISVTPIACINCGACVPACPKDAIDQNNFREKQLIAQVQGVSLGELKEPKIIAFIERKTAYSSLDLAGTRRLSYIANIRPITVPSCMRIGIKHLLNAFAYGADGVVFVEGDDSPFAGEKLLKHVTELKKELQKYEISPLRLQSMTTTIPQYDKAVKLFATVNARISRLGKIKAEEREKLKEKLQSAQSG